MTIKRRSKSGQIVAHKPTDITRAEVEALASFGTPQDQIGDYLGIDKKTLAKHYRKELDHAMLRANMEVVKSLYKKATGGDTAAAIYWTKARMGWKEKQEIAVTDPNGEPLQAAVVYLPDNGRGDRPV